MHNRSNNNEVKLKKERSLFKLKLDIMAFKLSHIVQKGKSYHRRNLPQQQTSPGMEAITCL